MRAAGVAGKSKAGRAGAVHLNQDHISPVERNSCRAAFVHRAKGGVMKGTLRTVAIGVSGILLLGLVSACGEPPDEPQEMVDSG